MAQIALILRGNFLALSHPPRTHTTSTIQAGWAACLNRAGTSQASCGYGAAFTWGRPGASASRTGRDAREDRVASGSRHKRQL